MIENLNLSHQNLVTDAIQKLGCNLSEYSFANLYLFRRLHQYKFVTGKHLFIRGISRDNFHFLMPLFPIQECTPSEWVSYMQSVDYLFPIPAEQLSLFDPSIFKWSSNEADSDYLFCVTKIKRYPGRHLDGKRSLVNHLLRNHQVVTQEITSDNLMDCQMILEKWQENTNLVKIQTDFQECYEGLQLMKKLSLCGRITYIDGKAAGFLLGEPIAKKTYAIHFSKAVPEIKGINQYMYQYLATELSPSFHWINMEQDLGMSSLRSAKRSYLPDRLSDKFRIMAI